MLNQNIKSNNLSDFQSTINVIQFEYQHYFKLRYKIIKIIRKIGYNPKFLRSDFQFILI